MARSTIGSECVLKRSEGLLDDMGMSLTATTSSLVEIDEHEHLWGVMMVMAGCWLYCNGHIAAALLLMLLFGGWWCRS